MIHCAQKRGDKPHTGLPRVLTTPRGRADGCAVSVSTSSTV